jgi:hypothetical protein
MKKIIMPGKTIVILMVLMLAFLSPTFSQITQVGSTQTAYAPSATSITLSKPAGLSTGDIMIVNIVKYTGSNSTNPSSNGWTLIDGAVLGGSNYVRGAVLYRIVDGTEGSSFTFSLGGYSTSAYSEGALVAYTNVDLTNPFDVTPGTITTPALRPGFTSTTVNPSGITTISSNALVLMLGMSYVADDAPPSTFESWSVTSPSMLELYDADGTLAVSVGAATGIQSEAGATGTGTITVSDEAYLGGIILALRPEPTAPILRVDPSSLDFGYAYTGSSVVRTFQLSGELLTGYPGNITVTAPSADFRVSNDNTTWGTTTTVAYTSSTLNSTTVYVMFAPQSSGVKSGNLTFSGGGVASPPTVSLTGIATTPATQLAFVNFPAAGATNSNFTAFTVEARTADNSVDFLYTGNITLTKATGSGTLSGTLTMTAVNGVASFSAVQVDQVDSYTLYANSGTLTQATSSTIVVAAGVLNDFRSAASGNWNLPATWETFTSSGWGPAASAPSSSANTITIRNGHVVTVTTSVNADQMVVDAGGQVTINSGQILTIRNGSGTDLTVFGTVDNSGIMIINTGGAAVYYSPGIYRHANASNTIPTATWNPGSTCEITGWTSAGALTNTFSQAFYNFTWNCPGQTANVSFGGFVNTVNGTFKLVSTGSVGTNPIISAGNPTYGNYEQTGGIYQLTDGYDARTLSVTGNFSISNGTFQLDLDGPGILTIGGDFSISGGTHTVGNSSTASKMTVAGDFSMTDGNFNLSTGPAASTLTVSGDFLMTSGTLTMSSETGNTTLFAGGNFSHTGGTITETSDGSGTIVFNGTYNSTEGTGIQTYTSGGTVTNIVNFTVNSNAFLQMAAPETVVTGSGIFILSSGATLGVTSPDGITSSGTTGNIQTGTRSFSSGANYMYNGTTGQSIGEGLPPTVSTLVFDNSGGDVTFSSARTITNNFSITSGSRANLGSNVHYAGTLTLGGVLQRSGSYGSPASIATYKSAAYFGTTASGIVIVSTGSIGSSWIGDTSSDWNTSSNWFSGVIPTSSADIIIASTATNQPVISGSTTAVCNSLTIGTGASLTISPTGKATFSSLINNGTLNLESDATGIASLILVSYTDNGTENIEMYLTGGGDEFTYPWHYISSPVTSLSTDVFTTGTGQSYDLAAYYEDHTSPDHSLRWIAWDGYDYSIDGYPAPPLVTFNTLEPGKGYNIYFYESSVEKTFGGTLNTTDEAESLSYTTGSSNDTQGWNLLGNPFTSGLNWNDITKPAGVDNAIYFNSNGTFASYVGGVGTPAGTSGLIPPMQGFFVKANQTGQSITLPASARVHSFHSRYKGDEETIPLIRLKIESQKASDETVIRFDEKANSTFDSELDAYKFSKTGTSVGLWTVNGTVSYSINSIPFPETEAEVSVGINVSESGNYKLTVNQLQGLDNYSVYLIDKTAGITTDLKTTSTISFASSKGMVTDRFIIKIIDVTTGIENPVLSENKFKIYASKDLISIQTLSDEWDGKSGSIDLLDMTGRTISKINNSEFWKGSLIQIPATGYKGVCFVKLQSGVMRYVGKVIIK